MNIDHFFTRKRSLLSQYVDEKHLQTIKNAYRESIEIKRNVPGEDEAERFIRFLFQYTHDRIKDAQHLLHLLQDFRKHISTVVSDFEKEQIIMEYARHLPSSHKSLFEDEKAFKRWFDEDALTERYKSKIAVNNRLIIVSLKRISVSMQIIKETQSIDIALWHRIEFNRHFLHILKYTHEPLVTHAVYSSLINIIKAIDATMHTNLLDDRLMKIIYHAALSEKYNVWIQNDAIELLSDTSMYAFISVAVKRAAQYSDDDNIFVRHKIAELAVKNAASDSTLATLIENVVMNDPSPYVRQALAKHLPLSTVESLRLSTQLLILNESEPSVRAQCLIQILSGKIDATLFELFKPIFWHALHEDPSPFVARTAIVSLQSLFQKQARDNTFDTLFFNECLEHLDTLIGTHTNVATRRHATIAREFILICSDPKHFAAYRMLHAFVQTIPPGSSKRLPASWKTLPPDQLHRILSVVAQNDFSMQLFKTLTGGLRLFRGDRFANRTWRILFEFLHPSPDKRQAFSHTIARVYDATHHFPSTVMAEQAPTKVPGEPYYIPEEQSWRPFLPLPDHLISSLKQPTLRYHPFKIYSAEGVTTITPPKTMFKRLVTEWKMTWNFAHVAALRNWQSHYVEAPDTYIRTVEEFGFTIDFASYHPGDNSCRKFFDGDNHVS